MINKVEFSENVFQLVVNIGAINTKTILLVEL